MADMRCVGSTSPFLRIARDFVFGRVSKFRLPGVCFPTPGSTLIFGRLSEFLRFPHRSKIRDWVPSGFPGAGMPPPGKRRTEPWGKGRFLPGATPPKFGAPPMLPCALRAYTKNYEGLQTFSEAWMEKPPKDFERILSVPEKFATED